MISYELLFHDFCFTFLRINYEVFRISGKENNNLVTGICVTSVVTNEEIKNEGCSGLPREHCSNLIIHV
jgi:hypothetical protein